MAYSFSLPLLTKTRLEGKLVTEASPPGRHHNIFGKNSRSASDLQTLATHCSPSPNRERGTRSWDLGDSAALNLPGSASPCHTQCQISANISIYWRLVICPAEICYTSIDCRMVNLSGSNVFSWYLGENKVRKILGLADIFFLGISRYSSQNA